MKKYFPLMSVISLSALMRLLPHPPNFAPVGAAALFSGCYFKKPWNYAAAPLALFTSDLFIGLYDWRIMAAVYGSFVVIALFGEKLRARGISPITLPAAAILSSIFFYAATNFAVWLFSPLYPATPAGLLACFVAALPFLKFTLAGDLAYSGFFFGLREIVVATKDPPCPAPMSIVPQFALASRANQKDDLTPQHAS